MLGRDACVHLDPQGRQKWNPLFFFRMQGNTRESTLLCPNAHYPTELSIEHLAKEKECQEETNVNTAGFAPRWIVLGPGPGRMTKTKSKNL